MNNTMEAEYRVSAFNKITKIMRLPVEEILHILQIVTIDGMVTPNHPKQRQEVAEVSRF